MWPVNHILMETEGPGFDSQKRHQTPLAQLVERRSYTRLYTYRAQGECPGFNPQKEYLFFVVSTQKRYFFLS